jgi:hypothetical protein
MDQRPPDADGHVQVVHLELGLSEAEGRHHVEATVRASLPNLLI